MTYKNFRRTTRNLILSITIICISSATFAHGSATSNDWEFNASMYLWATALGAETVTGDDIDVDFGDLLDNLEFALMGGGVARNGNWMIFTDIFYAKLGIEESTTATLVDIPATVDVELDLDINNWIIHLAGGYTVARNEDYLIDVIAGARFLYMDSDLEFEIGPLELEVNESEENLDAIIGLRTHMDLSEKWFLNTHFDVGTGESEFTWQAFAAIGYEFKSVDAVFGYRHIAWEFDEGDGLGKIFDDLEYTGPLFGASFKF